MFAGRVQNDITDCGCTHHQLCEHQVQLLKGGHGQSRLHYSHGVDVIMAVSDLWLVTSLEAARKQRGQATPLRLLHLGRHGCDGDLTRNILLKEQDKKKAS